MAVPLEKFVQQLEDSGILAGDTLKEFLPPKSQLKDAEELALELVRKKKLTKFQAEEISKGKGKSLLRGNYVVMEKIGAGGMGQVFKARHRRMDRLVAVKLLPAAMTKNVSAIARFEREVKAAAKLRHPNIIAADDADQANGVHFLVMEFVDGSDLSALVKKNGPFPVDQSVNYILQAAKGLEFAHAEGVVHRDIKPANLLLDKKGTVKILDMGLARIHGDAGQAELTSTGTVMGTVDYMAPEQALNTKTADARADIYALGCSLYYLLTGRATFDGDTLMAKLLAHRDQPIPDLHQACPQVPESLELIFRKMVAKKIEDRYQTMTDVIADLERCGFNSSRTQTLQNFSNTTVDKSATLTIRKETSAEATDLTTSLQTAGPAKTGNNKNRLLIGAAALGVMILLAGVVMKLRTKDGTLVVTVNEPDAEIQVLNEKNTVEITRKGDTGPISITVVPGKHRLKVQKEGFEFFTDSFEIKSGATESITAKLVPLENVAVAEIVVSGKPWGMPDFQQWMKDVHLMSAEQQVKAVSQKLMELNPGFDGNLEAVSPRQGPPWIENGVVTEIQFCSDYVSDLSPIRALTRLKRLGFCPSKANQKGKLGDLSPLVGMQLEWLACAYTLVSDLSHLKQMPLTHLSFAYTRVSDLTPLQGMPLTVLGCQDTLVADLSPLKGLPLINLTLENTLVSDISSLRDSPLETVSLTPKAITNGIEILREKGSIKTIAVGWDKEQLPAAEFWKKYDAGEFGKPSSLSNPLGFQTPGFDQWVKDVQAMSAEKQLDAVLKKLVELNPGFDGKAVVSSDHGTTKIEDGVVVEFAIFTDHVTDISPVRALPGLQNFCCTGSRILDCSGKLTDLRPLRGMRLEMLGCFGNPLSDLSPLRGVPLKTLHCDVTLVADLSPLKGSSLTKLTICGTEVTNLEPLRGTQLKTLIMQTTRTTDLSPLKNLPLEELNCRTTQVTDLSALKSVPLTTLWCDLKPERDLEVLRSIKTLKTLNDQPASDTLK